MQVQAILSRKGDRVATIEPGASIGSAVRRLSEEGVGALVVEREGRTIGGILSERDIVRRLAAVGTAALDEPVASAMTTDVLTCRASDEIEHLMRLMTDRRVRHLPVVDPAGVLAGIVSIGDVVKLRLTELESENQSLIGYLSNTP